MSHDGWRSAKDQMKSELLIRHPPHVLLRRCYVYYVCGRMHTLNATATWHIQLICTLPSLLGLWQPKPLSNFQQPSLKNKRYYNLEKRLVWFVSGFPPAQR